MQNITSSFARDWQFVKISRNWKPHDFSKEVLDRLINENNRNLNDKISSIVYDIGSEEGREIKASLGDRMEIHTVIEGILLISGQNYSTKRENERTEIIIMKTGNPKENIHENQDIISYPYLKGVIKSIVPGSQFFENNEIITILF